MCIWRDWVWNTHCVWMWMPYWVVNSQRCHDWHLSACLSWGTSAERHLWKDSNVWALSSSPWLKQVAWWAAASCKRLPLFKAGAIKYPGSLPSTVSLKAIVIIRQEDNKRTHKSFPSACPRVAQQALGSRGTSELAPAAPGKEGSCSSLLAFHPTVLDWGKS